MLDKLNVSGRLLDPTFLKLARTEGKSHPHYEKVLDLRKYGLPASLHCFWRNSPTPMHMLQLLRVGHLGWQGCLYVLERVFVDLGAVWISRVDIAVDVFGVPLVFFRQHLRCQRCHAIRVEMGPKGESFYPWISDRIVVLIYDKGKDRRDPAQPFYSQFEHAIRIERQYRKSGVPFKRLADIQKYRELDPLEGLEYCRVRTAATGMTPIQSLAAQALIAELEKRPLAEIIKSFPSPHRRMVLKLLGRIVDGPDTEAKYKASFDYWKNKLWRFPRRHPREQKAHKF
jgi:hypothetical protein